MYSEETIRNRVVELGASIAGDYEGKVPLLIAVLNGSVVFLADLIRVLDIPLHLDFMAVSSYRPSAGGAVRIIKDLDQPVAGRPVLIIEDIIDTGLTIGYLVRSLGLRDPADISICTLLNRTVRRLVDLPIKYVGFEIPDQFLVGYGLDSEQAYRNLPFLGILPEHRRP